MDAAGQNTHKSAPLGGSGETEWENLKLVEEHQSRGVRKAAWGKGCWWL